MIVELETATDVFKKIYFIRQEYRAKILNGDANVISIENLQWVIEQMYELKIDLRQVPFEGDFIRGMVERRDDSLRIYVRQNQTLAWLRFTAVKEMCHGVIDEKEDWSTDGVATLEDVLAERMAQQQSNIAARTTQSELFAELAAIELLYPFECRTADMEKLDNGGTTVVKIATYHEMPEAMVDRAVSEDYRGFAEEMWLLVQEQD